MIPGFHLVMAMTMGSDGKALGSDGKAEGSDGKAMRGDRKAAGRAVKRWRGGGAQVEAVEEALQVELHRPKSLSRQRTERSRRGRRVVSSPELALHGGAGSSDSLAAGRHSGDPSARPSIDETAPVDM